VKKWIISAGTGMALLISSGSGMAGQWKGTGPGAGREASLLMSFGGWASETFKNHHDAYLGIVAPI
jgi:hypothetical protein